jgi:hemerythrin
MAFVDWSNKYSVYDKELDEQHQGLFSVVNDLHKAILAKHGKEELGHTIDKLVAYTQSHFAAEERLMQACDYPDYQSHKEEHEKLIKRVSEMDHELRKTDSNVAPDVLAFLVKDWLIGHILNEDKKYALSIQAHRRASPVAHSARHPS